PINVCAVLKYDEDVAIIEHRLGANGLYVWRRQERRYDGVGDLIFDDVGRFAFPTGMNDDLNVGNIRQGIERDVFHAPDSRQGQQCNTCENQEAIVSAPLNDAGDHDYMPPAASRVNCLLAMAWPF